MTVAMPATRKKGSVGRRTINMKIMIAMAFAAGLIAGIFLNNLSSESLQAAAQPKSCAIPKNYRSLKAVFSDHFAFEASDGTVRLVSLDCQLRKVLTRD